MPLSTNLTHALKTLCAFLAACEGVSSLPLASRLETALAAFSLRLAASVLAHLRAQSIEHTA